VRQLALVSVLLAVLVAAGCGGGGGGTGSSTADGCTDVTAPKPRKPAAVAVARPALDPAKTWQLTFETSCGRFVVALDPTVSPRATASLVALARQRYFDGTIFHRIVPGFVIQGGSPTQTGSGGPGYTTVDTPDASTRYVKGTVAMAKTATEPRGTAGSQFFVMTADAPTLDPDYAVVGRVATGMPVVERIGELGDASDPDGTPTQTVVIDKVTVSSQ
jgi:cyclophilin family peptidyl-prolyl cis-trans isomerase